MSWDPGQKSTNQNHFSPRKVSIPKSSFLHTRENDAGCLAVSLQDQDNNWKMIGIQTKIINKTSVGLGTFPDVSG